MNTRLSAGRVLLLWLIPLLSVAVLILPSGSQPQSAPVASADRLTQTLAVAGPVVIDSEGRMTVEDHVIVPMTSDAPPVIHPGDVVVILGDLQPDQTTIYTRSIAFFEDDVKQDDTLPPPTEAPVTPMPTEAPVTMMPTMLLVSMTTAPDNAASPMAAFPTSLPTAGAHMPMVLLTGAVGLTDGKALAPGEFQVEWYCHDQGYSVWRDNDHWYCNSRRQRVLTLGQDDFTRICQITYNDGSAVAVQDGTSRTPAFNWRCYGDAKA